MALSNLIINHLKYTTMRSSHKTIQFIDAIIAAADRLDHNLVNEFMNAGTEAVEAHFEITKETLTELQQLQRQRVMNTGHLLLCLFNSLRNPAAEVKDYNGLL